MPAPNAAALLRRNGTHPSTADRPAMRFGDAVWTHADLLTESVRFAALFDQYRTTDRPCHLGVLLDNTPDYVFALGGAAMSGGVVVGLNHTRRGEHLLRDIIHTDVDAVVTEPRHQNLLEPIFAELPAVLVSNRFVDDDDPPIEMGESLEDALPGLADDSGFEPDADAMWALIFTSGTSSAPKAVICSQTRLLVTGNRMSMIMDLGPDDVGYVCMPLFHSNALMVGVAPALVVGGSFGLARKFSASRWLADVRRYGATYFNYTGKPLSYLVATPARPDDADNSLRVAFGNEGAPDVVETFARRFGVEVIDAYGATEGGIGVNREAEARRGALGQAPDHIRVVDPDGNDLASARLDANGRLTNADECVGEIVNVAGVGPFEGYYSNPEANDRLTRFGWYWSGDLGYLDADRYLYFAGRDADWIRVDGENFPAHPIEVAINRHPDVVLAAAYGVPDEAAGDQVMAAVVLRDGAELDPAAFAAFVDAQPDLGPKWRPRYLRVLREPPTTGTNKVVKRTLVSEKWRTDRVAGDAIWIRVPHDDHYQSFTPETEATLEAAFRTHDRTRFWDL